MRLLFAALGAAAIIGGHAVAAEITVESFPIAGNRPHDVAPAPDGGVWYTAQRSGFLGKLDPKTGEVVQITLGRGSAPHGVIVGPEGNAWITDGGQNAIVKVDARSHDVTVFPLPASAPSANLNTAAFDGNGVLWWTGQSGYYGRLDPVTGTVEAWRAPRGRGHYGITATPDGQIYYASLAGSYIAKVDILTGEATVIEPPTPNQGARRVWSDSKGNIWVSEWNAGQVARYVPETGEWTEWQLPGARPQAYAVYVDEQDIVWLTDFGANAVVRFDPLTEEFTQFPGTRAGARARDRAELVTDDKAALRETLEAVTGERIAALEAVEPEKAKERDAGRDAVLSREGPGAPERELGSEPGMDRAPKGLDRDMAL